MINSVSSVSFKSNAGVDVIGRQGAYTKPQQAPNVSGDVAPKKSSSFLKGLAKFVAAAVIVGGGLLLGFKKGAVKVLDEAAKADAGIMKKAGHYLAKGGEWVDANVWNKLTGLFSKKSAEKAAEVVA